MLAFFSSELAKEAEKWGLTVATIPKGAYPFITRDESTLAIWNAIVVGDHVSEETVYKFTKAVMENEARMRSIHPTLAQFSRTEAVKNITGLSVHKGAERYYREAGLRK